MVEMDMVEMDITECLTAGKEQDQPGDAGQEGMTQKGWQLTMATGDITDCSNAERQFIQPNGGDSDGIECKGWFVTYLWYIDTEGLLNTPSPPGSSTVNHVNPSTPLNIRLLIRSGSETAQLSSEENGSVLDLQNALSDEARLITQARVKNYLDRGSRYVTAATESEAIDAELRAFAAQHNSQSEQGCRMMEEGQQSMDEYAGSKWISYLASAPRSRLPSPRQYPLADRSIA